MLFQYGLEPVLIQRIIGFEILWHWFLSLDCSANLKQRNNMKPFRHIQPEEGCVTDINSCCVASWHSWRRNSLVRLMTAAYLETTMSRRLAPVIPDHRTLVPAAVRKEMMCLKIIMRERICYKIVLLNIIGKVSSMIFTETTVHCLNESSVQTILNV